MRESRRVALLSVPEGNYMRDLLQSLQFANIAPMCPNHQPKGEYVQMPEEDGGGVLYEVTCPNCNYHGIINPDALEDL